MSIVCVPLYVCVYLLLCVALCHHGGCVSLSIYMFSLAGSMLLCVLAVLHVWWFFLMLRIFYKMTFTTCSPACAGAAVYEGKDDRAKAE